MGGSSPSPARGDSFALQADGAVHEPLEFHHVGEQEAFGGCGGFVLRGELAFEFGKLFGIFARDEERAAGETVAERVHGRCGFSRFRAGAGGLWLSYRFQ